MIFVTTGMHPSGFERLVRAMDDIAGKIEEEVVMQIGGTEYTPKNARYFDFASEAHMKESCREARVVVAHGGAGTILDLLESGTPLVVVPRQRRYSEAIDDHQVHLVRELERAGKVTAVYNEQELEDVLLKLDAKPAEPAKDNRLVVFLKRYVAELDQAREPMNPD